MNENRSKRREWVKTAAIIFLSIMLVLTFFSQTILNHSLPEVATKYVESGTITTKIRGSGVVESGDPYVIEVPGIYVGRKVSSVLCKVGDTVQKGDILLYLAEGDGTELEAAREALKLAQAALESAQDAYDTYILDANITNSDITSANANVSTATLRKMITDLQTSLNEEKEKVPPLETAVAQLEQAIADCGAQISYEEQQKSLAASRVATAALAVEQAAASQSAAQNAVNDAEAAWNAVNEEQTALETQITEGLIPEEEIEAKRADVAARRDALETNLKEKKTALENANSALNTANQELAEAQRILNERESSQSVNNISKLKADYELSLYNTNKQLSAVNAEIASIEKEITGLAGTSSVIKRLQELQAGIDDAKAEVAEKKKKVTELEAEADGSAITSDISGTITAVNVTSGKQITTQDVMILQPEGQGYFMSFSVTNDQAKMLSVGDKANLINSWYYNDLDVILKSIKPDKSDPGKKKMLTFTINGETTVGQNISVSVGQRSQNYDCIVPNSAIREDNNGKFILIVESRNSPVGNRYIATRVDVEVLASDDTQTAVSGALNGWEYVITTSSKPVNPGDQVRMTDN